MSADAAAAALRAVARFGLGGASTGPVAHPLDTTSWQSLLHEVRRERLVAVLEAAVAVGEVAATPDQVAMIELEASQAASAVSRLEVLLVEVASWLGGAGIEFRVLKGPAVARLDFEHARLRSYADIDLLVRGPDLASASEVLALHGFGRDLPERRPGFDRRFLKEIPMADDLGREIDVHRTLALGAFGLALDLDALWERSAPFALAGAGDLLALDAEGRFVHACFNAVLGDARPRLVALRDIAHITRRHDLNRARLEQLVPAGRGAAVVGAALELCRRELSVEVTVDLPAAARASLLERTALRCYRARGGSNTLELLSGVLGLRRPSEIASYVAATVRPDRGYRQARVAAGRTREWPKGLNELLTFRTASPKVDSEPGGAVDDAPEALPLRKVGLGDVELDGQRVVWDPVSGQVARLDRMASLVWAHLDGTTPIAELVDDIVFAFGAERSVVDSDVRRLLTHLAGLGVTVVPSGAQVA